MKSLVHPTCASSPGRLLQMTAGIGATLSSISAYQSRPQVGAFDALHPGQLRPGLVGTLLNRPIAAEPPHRPPRALAANEAVVRCQRPKHEYQGANFYQHCSTRRISSLC